MATEGAASVTRLPAVLRSHPALLVEWLQLVNWCSRWREEGGRAAVLAGSVAGVAVLLIAGLSFHAADQVAELIERLDQYRVLVAAIAMLCTWTTVSRRRRHIEESQSRSWLVATPISPSSLRLSLVVRTLHPIVLSFTAVAILSLAFALHADAAKVATVVAALSGGTLIGCAAGWLMASRAPKQAGTVASRYVPRPRVRTNDPTERRSAEARAAPAETRSVEARTTQLQTSSAETRAAHAQPLALKPDSAALSRWPIAQVLSWSRPDNSRYVLIVALLAVQGGSSAIAGLAVVATYFIASYLVALLSAMTTVARSAASWLRSTPMSLGDFAWSLARRALVHQFAGTAFTLVAVLMLGAPSVALKLAAFWLGLVIAISGSALFYHYRGRSPRCR